MIESANGSFPWIKNLVYPKVRTGLVGKLRWNLCCKTIVTGFVLIPEGSEIPDLSRYVYDSSFGSELSPTPTRIMIPTHPMIGHDGSGLTRKSNLFRSSGEVVRKCECETHGVIRLQVVWSKASPDRSPRSDRRTCLWFLFREHVQSTNHVSSQSTIGDLTNWDTNTIPKMIMIHIPVQTQCVGWGGDSLPKQES